MTERDIRDAMLNAGPGEAESMPLPGLHEVVWEDREYLGWRDPQAPQRAYLAFWQDGRVIGLTLRASESRMQAGSAMCSLCQIHQPASQVRMFSAPRVGEAGRRGNSVGTYICADLACSLLIRIAPPRTAFQPDPNVVIADRASGLSTRVSAFAARVLEDAA